MEEVLVKTPRELLGLLDPYKQRRDNLEYIVVTREKELSTHPPLPQLPGIMNTITGAYIPPKRKSIRRDSEFMNKLKKRRPAVFSDTETEIISISIE